MHALNFHGRVERFCQRGAPRALATLSRAERALGETDAARAHCTEAVAIFTELGDTKGAAATRADLETL